MIWKAREATVFGALVLLFAAYSPYATLAQDGTDLYYESIDFDDARHEQAQEGGPMRGRRAHQHQEQRQDPGQTTAERRRRRPPPF